MYTSLYDTNPLPEPGESTDTSEPTPVALSKSLQVNWATPQPLHTYTPPAPGSQGDDGGGDNGGGDNGGGDGREDSGSGAVPKLPRLPSPADIDGMVMGLRGPEFDAVHVRPEDLLQHEQVLLDAATTLAQNFNALVTASEAAMTAQWWGMEEGENETQKPMPGTNNDPLRREPNPEWEPQYMLSPSAISTRKFVDSLRMNQRAALQHCADVVTLSGGFIELLNVTADAYGQGDQACVFPDKSSMTTG